MKQIVAGSFLAAGLILPAADAQTPLVDAFAPYLGSCWSAPLGDLPVPEIQCFEALENDFVRRTHSVAGPHGMHYGEEVMHWDSETNRIVTRYYNDSRGVVDSDGAIVEGAPVLFSYNDWDGGLQLRMHWGAVTGDEAVFQREQYFGPDFGGWNTEEPRIFTRTGPASGFDAGSGNQYPRGDTVEAFGPLLNACWSAPFEGSERLDIHCFSSVFGIHVRDRHISPGAPDYTGETIFHTDAETSELRFRYFNSIGGVSNGTGTPGDGEIVFSEETYIAGDGSTRRFRGRYSDISIDGYESVTEELENGEWITVSRQHFTRAENPFAPD